MCKILDRLKKNVTVYEDFLSLKPDFDDFFITKINPVINRVPQKKWLDFIKKCVEINDNSCLTDFLPKNGAVSGGKKIIWNTFCSFDEKIEFEEQFQKNEKTRSVVAGSFDEYLKNACKKDNDNLWVADKKACYRKALILGLPISSTTIYPYYHYGKVILKAHPVFLQEYTKNKIGANAIIVEIFTKNEWDAIADDAIMGAKINIVPLKKLETQTFENTYMLSVRIKFDTHDEIFTYTKGQLINRALCMSNKKTIEALWGYNSHKNIEMLVKTAIYQCAKRFGVLDIYELDIATYDDGDGVEVEGHSDDTVDIVG